MRIAVIEDNVSFKGVLQDLMKKPDWEVDFYQTPSEFGRTDLNKYDVIISDQKLPGVSGRDLIKSIAFKTHAQCFLIGEHFEQEDIQNETIKGLIDRRIPETIIEKLNFADVKMRINNLMEKEHNGLSSLFPANGYNLKIEDGMAFLTIEEILSEASKTEITNTIKKSGIKNLVVSFGTEGVVSSPYLSILVYLFKLMKSLEGKMVFLNSGGETLLEQMRLCNLTMLIPVVDSAEDAKAQLVEK